jgi:heptosyltransferase I
MQPPHSPPKTVCLLRLSAIGDACHVVPLLRVLQRAWPDTRFTWVIGRIESRLLSLLPEVEFITVDKRAGLAGLRALRQQLAARRFDALLDLQVSVRASLVAACIPARLRLGFDRARAREGQWLVTNARIEAREREHVQDSFLGFARWFGLDPGTPRWEVPLPDDALDYAERLIPAGNTLVISPCSSHRLRNWRAERYAAVATHAVQAHGLRVILTGGPSPLEREMAAAIVAATPVAVVDQVGKDTLPQLLALLARATALLTPDSGPAHMATMVDTPVLGLYAATNPARSGPWRSRQWCVDAYAEAARRFRRREPADLPWTEKIEEPGVMDLVTTAAVVERLDALLAQRQVTGA